MSTWEYVTDTRGMDHKFEVSITLNPETAMDFLRDAYGDDDDHIPEKILCVGKVTSSSIQLCVLEASGAVVIVTISHWYDPGSYYQPEDYGFDFIEEYST